MFRGRRAQRAGRRPASDRAREEAGRRDAVRSAAARRRGWGGVRLPCRAVRDGTQRGSRDPRERSERGLGRRSLPVGQRTPQQALKRRSGGVSGALLHAGGQRDAVCLAKLRDRLLSAWFENRRFSSSRKSEIFGRQQGARAVAAGALQTVVSIEAGASHRAIAYKPTTKPPTHPL